MEFDTRNYVFVCFSISLQRFFLLSAETTSEGFDFKRFSSRRIAREAVNRRIICGDKSRERSQQNNRNNNNNNNSFVSCVFFPVPSLFVVFRSRPVFSFTLDAIALIYPGRKKKHHLNTSTTAYLNNS